MQVFYEVTLVAFLPKSFEDKEGVTVSYNECYFVNEDDEGKRDMIILNTKIDLSQLEGSKGHLEVEIDSSGKRKPRLVSFTSEAAPK